MSFCDVHFGTLPFCRSTSMAAVTPKWSWKGLSDHPAPGFCYVKTLGTLDLEPLVCSWIEPTRTICLTAELIESNSLSPRFYPKWWPSRNMKLVTVNMFCCIFSVCIICDYKLVCIWFWSHPFSISTRGFSGSVLAILGEEKRWPEPLYCQGL